MDYSQFGAMLPELIILGLFLVVFLFDTFSGDGAKRILTPLTTVLFGLATVAIWIIPSCDMEVFGGMYVNDTACKAMKAILNVGVFIVFLQSAKWVESDEVAIRKGEFYELLLVTLFGMYLMISARHFLLFIIGLESASLPLAALVAFNKKHYESHEAAAKYILTAVFSSAILLMGLSFVYAFSGGSLYFDDIRNNVIAGEWMMYGVIIVTITVGNLFAIRQKNMKRFMAFSSISQAGYIMLGVMAGGIGLASMMFYILVYIVSNLGAFAVISSIENNTGKLSMDDYDGLHKTNPWLSFAMTLAMFSLAGIPPFAGFFSKILIFTAVTSTGSMALYMLVLIALINTIISLYYYLLVVKAIWIKPGEAKVESFKSAIGEKLALWICVAGIIFAGLVPYVYEYCYKAVLG